MSNDIFHFKQFSICQSQCAMKVGTDGILLGAWATSLDHDIPRTVLDIGTGTGLLALMAAQRWPDAHIDAVEIDAAAAHQAASNVTASRWATRIAVHHAPLSTFACDVLQSSRRYDVVLCNPPFYNATLKPDDAARAAARHTDSLPWSELMSTTEKLLAANGRAYFIVPYSSRGEVIFEALATNMAMSREMRIVTRKGKQPKRVMVELAKCAVVVPAVDELMINDGSSTSAEFRRLTKDFYLAGSEC